MKKKEKIQEIKDIIATKEGEIVQLEVEIRRIEHNMELEGK